MSPIPPAACPPVSVVMAVVDESRHIESAVRQILAQDYPGEIEVAVAVGPSRDDTRAIVDRLSAYDPRVLLVDNPSGRTAAGLNAAIAASHHSIVARVDGHSLLPPHYLRRAVELLVETGAANVGGMMAAEGVSDFEQAVACAMTSWLGVGGARFHTGGERGFVDTVYLGVFRREVLAAAGGYDESFLRAQDWELNYRIRQAGGRILFDPDLRVTYRPRSTPGSLARQYFHYGRWRRVVVRQHRGSVTPRYLAPPAALLAVGAGAGLGLLGWRPGWLAPGGYAAGILAGSAVLGRRLPARARIALPLVFATMHGAWGAGFLTSPRSLRPDAEERLAEAAAETSTTPPSGPPTSV